MMRKMLRVILVIFIAGTLWSCYPEGPDYYDDYDIVYTNYDNNYVFTGKAKYAIPDKIIKITGNMDAGKPPEYVSGTYSTQMLNSMKANMASLGYSLVDINANPDFVLMPSALESTNVEYYYDYWGYYWGWYYPYPMTYTYKSGSLMMDLIDYKDVSADGKRRVVWTGIINGLLEGSSSEFTARMNKTIDQAFSQSEYLRQ
jgi:hypothetical protein